MNLLKSAKILYGLTGAIVVITIGLLYLQNNSLTDLRGSVAGLKTTADQQKDAPEKLITAEKDLTTLKGQLSHLEQGIPEAAYVPTMLKELEQLGKVQGVEISGLRPVAKQISASAEKKPEENRPYEPLDLELKGKASYEDLLKFLTALNTFPKILEVRTVAIAPATTNDGSTGKLEITMGIRAFLFKQPSAQKTEDMSA